MNDLILLTIGCNEPLRAATLDDAATIAIAKIKTEGRIICEVIPAGGGIVQTLEFDRIKHDWVAQRD